MPASGRFSWESMAQAELTNSSTKQEGLGPFWPGGSQHGCPLRSLGSFKPDAPCRTLNPTQVGLGQGDRQRVLFCFVPEFYFYFIFYFPNTLFFFLLILTFLNHVSIEAHVCAFWQHVVMLCAKIQHFS